jgi:hypothetical protein
LGKKRYLCTKNGHSFVVDHRRKPQPFWLSHVDGTPFRKIADQNNITHGRVYQVVEQELKTLPYNTALTNHFCNRWCGVLVVDGKYAKVKGYNKKIPFIYGIDYLTHDIPLGIIAPSENELAYSKYFKTIKAMGYSLQVVVCDDNAPLHNAVLDVFPRARIQLCNTHFLENIRQQLNIRTQQEYQEFFKAIHKAFNTTIRFNKREQLLRDVYYNHAKHDEGLQHIIAEIMRRQHHLFAYSKEEIDVPNTTNIIESYNSHLEGRLKSMKGFQSMESAKRWFNAWMLRRRTKPFTDCTKKFKHLNGKMPIEQSIKKEKSLDNLLKLIYS